MDKKPLGDFNVVADTPEWYSELSISIDDLVFIDESNKIEAVTDVDSLLQSVYAWRWLKAQTTLSHGVILKVHKVIMLNTDLAANEKGHYRDLTKTNVTIAGRIAPLHYMVPGIMDNWLLDFHDPSQFNDPLTAHLRFEHCHPFVDGNGRTGRMLLRWHQMMMGQELTTFYNADKHKVYYKLFKGDEE